MIYLFDVNEINMHSHLRYLHSGQIGESRELVFRKPVFLKGEGGLNAIAASIELVHAVNRWIV